MHITFSGNKKALEIELSHFWLAGVSIFLGKLCFAGEQYIHYHLLFSAFIVSCAYFVVRLFYSFLNTGFSFDDAAEQIKTSKGKIIPYNKIKRIYIGVSFDGTLSSSAFTFLSQHLLFLSDNIDEQERLLAETRKRFPKVVFKRSKADKKKIANYFEWSLIFFVMAIATFFTARLYYKNPSLKIFPQKIEVKTNKNNFSSGKIYNFDGTKFIVPSEFNNQNKDSETERKNLYFATDDKQVFIVAKPTSPDLKKIKLKDFDYSIYGFLIEIKFNNFVDFFKGFATTRLGIVPLNIKALLYGLYPSLESIYDIKKRDFDGYFAICKYRDRYDIVEIEIYQISTKNYLEFSILFKKELDMRFVKEFLEGIH